VLASDEEVRLIGDVRVVVFEDILNGFEEGVKSICTDVGLRL
jgi:hypothetical protein